MLTNFASGIEISVGSQQLFDLLGFPITNALLTGALSLAYIMFGIFWYVTGMVKNAAITGLLG